MRVAVLGATGYTGIELLRLLDHHPQMELTYIASDSRAGLQVGEVLPHLRGVTTASFEKGDVARIAACADVALLALPSGLSVEWAAQLLTCGVKVIDLSGDHRLPPALYQEWYKKTPPEAVTQQQAVYGLSEFYGADVAQAKLIANPGCYPTATLLSLLPLVQRSLIDPQTLVIDAKSGVSGAGKAATAATHYVEVNENFKAYKVGGHQHIPEIEHILTRENPTGERVTISFTTHLVPMTRGILVTSYAKLTGSHSTEELLHLYADTYRDHPFVRIHPQGSMPQTRDVAKSNFCDIGLHVDPRTERVTVIAVIDNLVKGASGQAIQNLNLLAGLDPTTGLFHSPVYL
ncbi:MAG TPA: N-acetyl-gamma-glutamyl-phosphate reductase [Bacilli bacterium]|nr:N-acetyl-gamma-glutamyl-phosphate reductase [Bacilli bacterium]